MSLYKRRKQKSRINIIYKREKIRREIWAILPCGFWAQKKPPFPKKERSNFGASSRTRTDDLRITNALLYQLSHTSSCFVKLHKDGGLSGTTMIF